METILRVIAIYIFLMLGLRLLGKREFSQLSPFELVTLLLIPEIVQQSIVGEDFSITNAFIGLTTLFLLVFLTSLITYRFKKTEIVIEGKPSVLVCRGAFVAENLDKERVQSDEIFSEMHKSGLAELNEVRWAILEPDGKISIIPERQNDKQVRARSKEMN